MGGNVSAVVGGGVMGAGVLGVASGSVYICLLPVRLERSSLLIVLRLCVLCTLRLSEISRWRNTDSSRRVRGCRSATHSRAISASASMSHSYISDPSNNTTTTTTIAEHSMVASMACCHMSISPQSTA